MSLTVYKYEVPADDNFTLEMPAGAQCLSVQAQYEKPFLWALVDPGARKTKRQFRLAGTGHAIAHDSAALRFIGTAALHGGALIFHLFEVLP